jgi:WD40 repeat protein
MSSLEKVWEKKPESVRKTGTQDQLKVLIDPSASIIIASSSDKFVTVYEAATGNIICRMSCGEITTAMCLSTNLKHLITASADGIIYIWRLPDPLIKSL